jgi:hypothetical protein
MENYRENRYQLYKRFEKLGPANPYPETEVYNKEYNSEAGIDRLVSNTKRYLREDYTRDQFIKKFACDKDAFKSSEYCGGQSTPVTPTTPGTSETNPIFSCVEKRELEVGTRVIKKTERFLLIKKQKYWAFNKFGGWQQIKDGKIEFRGKWECDGESEYKIIADDGEIYESKNRPVKWVTPTQETVPSFDRTKFPLKKGSRGTEVCQLQKYLNKLIPQDPLVTDGIFGDKTYNKLVQLQKSTGII